MEGLYPACIEVEATVNNPKESALKDVSVYGMVKENDAGNSVLPNNPDFSTDAGQYAMIKRVEPGEQDIKFQFVAATTKSGQWHQLSRHSSPLTGASRPSQAAS